MNYWANFFYIGMYGCICRGHKMCESDRNQPSGYRDTRVENGKLAVPVINTLMHHTAFFAADTRPCVLI